jgi:hypothetical protein
MARQHHTLKIIPEYYRAIERGDKTFEVRKNDRNFQVYDILELKEFFGGEYSGRYINAEVTYILDDQEYCKEGYVIMGIKVNSIYN